MGKKTIPAEVETEHRWIRQAVVEYRYFLVEVIKGANEEAIIDAAEETALYCDCDPHETETKDEATMVCDNTPSKKEIDDNGGGFDLVAETKQQMDLQ